VLVKRGHNVRVPAPLLAGHENEAILRVLDGRVLDKVFNVHAGVKVHPLGVKDDEDLAGGVGESSPADQLNLVAKFLTFSLSLTKRNQS
jgi:hypothetical protein